jgi:tetratricopeptide (TPR) repeat protein
MTQGNLANLYASLSDNVEEDRRIRQRQSIQAVVTALDFFERVGHAVYVAQAQRQALGLRSRFGNDVFDALWNELGLGTLPDWLSQGAADLSPGPSIPPELQARLAAAGVTDDASLHAALEHDPDLRAAFEQWLSSQNPEAMMQATMAALLNAFVQVQNAEQMVAFWQAVPTEMEEPLMAAVEALIAQAEQAGDADTVAHLRSRLQGFREIRAGAASTLAAGQPILALLQDYQAHLQAADAEQPQVAPWQVVVALGERLLAMEAGAQQLLNWDDLRERVANDYNTLGNAHDAAGDPAASLVAFERAVALQPDFAMWRRNQAGTLIDLGRLEEAAAAIAAARRLEPDAPRLAQLAADLARAQERGA